MKKVTSIKELSIRRISEGNLQNGTDPVGSTSLMTNFTLESSNQSLDQPTSAPAESQLLLESVGYFPNIGIVPGYVTMFYGQWATEGKLRNGEPITIRRGSLVKTHNVEKIITVNTGSTSTPTIAKLGNYFTDEKITMDSFLGSGGYDFSNYDVGPNITVHLDSRMTTSSPQIQIESSFLATPMLVNEFLFDLKLSWYPDPAISAVAIRWRPVPGIKSISELSYNIDNSGTGYTYPPKLTVYKQDPWESGSGAEIEAVLGLTGQIASIRKIQEGGGYLWKPYVSVEGDGTGAAISVSLETRIFPRLNFVRVISPGTGYTAGSVVSITGGSGPGTDEAFAIIRNNELAAIQLTSSSRNYESSQPVVSISGGSGAVCLAMTDTNSQWIYESALSSNHTISNLNRGLEYEVQILKSPDPLFRGNMRYSDSVKIFA